MDREDWPALFVRPGEIVPRTDDGAAGNDGLVSSAADVRTVSVLSDSRGTFDSLDLGASEASPLESAGLLRSLDGDEAIATSGTLRAVKYARAVFRDYGWWSMFCGARSNLHCFIKLGFKPPYYSTQNAISPIVVSRESRCDGPSLIRGHAKCGRCACGAASGRRTANGWESAAPGEHVHHGASTS